MNDWRTVVVAMSEEQWRAWVELLLEAPSSDIREYISDMEELRKEANALASHITHRSE